MAVVKNKTNDANREYWSHVEEVAEEVGKWPRWMNRDVEASNNEEEPKNLRSRAANAGGDSASSDK